MAGFLDKAKSMLGGSKSADAGDGDGLDGLKDQAGAAKDKADDLVEQHGDKAPEGVKDAYDKVSDKVEDVIPGDGE